MKKLFLSLIVVAAASSACRRADEIARDVSTSVSEEQRVYMELSLRKNQSGEANYYSLVNWKNALGRLESESGDLARTFAKLDASEKAKYQTMVDSLKEPLEKVFERKEALELTIPSWFLSDARQALRQIDATASSIKANYLSLFGKYPNSTDFAAVSVAEDTKLYDTYRDCVSMFKIYELVTPYCYQAAERGCGHQVDMDVLRTWMLQNAYKMSQTGCAEERTSFSDPNQKEKYMAEWAVEGIRSCTSKTPVYSK